MKTYKLLVLVGDSEYVLDHFPTDNLSRNHVVYNEEPRMQVVEVRHEEPIDNMVEVFASDHEWSFIRDVSGKLWYFYDFWTKTDIINKFE